jgi:uncharacterized protein (TIGR00106 family)
LDARIWDSGFWFVGVRRWEMALMEINIVPVGAGVSLSSYIAKAVLALEGEPEIDYELTSMGTNVAGDLDRLFAVASKMHRVVMDSGVQRVVTTIKIDDRKDKPVTLSSKLESVRKKLGEQD